MKTPEWPVLLMAVAGVVAALGAIPDSNHRAVVLIVAASFILAALLIAAISTRRAKRAFTAERIQPDPPGGDSTDPIFVGGTLPKLRSDTLWVVEEGVVDGLRVWLFGGEALVLGRTWRFEYEPRASQTSKAHRTLSVVRADRNGERQLRSLRADDGHARIIYGPPPGGCKVLGQITIQVTSPRTGQSE